MTDTYTVERTEVSARGTGIGGSDVAALVNMDPYRTAFDVWEEKVNGVKPTFAPGAKRWLDRGHRLEPIINAMYQESCAENGTRVVVTTTPLMYRSAKCPWMVAHLDGTVEDANEDDVGVLECKHANLALYATIKRDGLPYHWLLQVQHYLFVTGREWADVAVLNAERWELLVVRVRADDKLRQALVALEADFWHSHVLAKAPPPVVPVSQPEVPLPAATSGVQQMTDPAFANAVRLWLDAKATEDAAESLKEAARVEMLAAIGRRLGVYEGAGVRVYYTQATRTGRFDKDALRRLGAIDPMALQLWAQGKHLDLPQLEQVMLDLTQFEQPPTTYEQLRVYPVAPTAKGEA
jgi:putative phage-type endonuclease